MAATHTKTVRLQPNGEDRGTMTVLGRSTGEPYRLGNRKADIEPGVYEVDFVRGDHVVFLNRISPVSPTSSEEVSAMLRMVRGVSPRKAELILQGIEHLSMDEQIEKLSNEDFLTEIDGIGSVLAGRIVDRMGGTSGEEKRFLTLLRTYGISIDVTKAWFSFARYVYTQFQASALDDLEENPYTLCHLKDIPGAVSNAREESISVGTLSVEEVDDALLETDPRWQHHKYRAAEHLLYAVRDATSDGHSVVRLDEVLRRLRSQYKIAYILEDLESDEAQPLTEEMARSLAREVPELQSFYFMDADGEERWGLTTRSLWLDYRVSTTTAERLLQADPIFSDNETDAMFERAVETAGVDFTSSQESAIKNALCGRVSAITGAAGTGKSTVVQALLNGMMRVKDKRTSSSPFKTDTALDKTGFHFYICAPTGVATQRLRRGLELVDPKTDEPITPANINHDHLYNSGADDHMVDEGKVFIGTLHKFLGYNGTHFNRPRPHPCVLVVDEFSMCDEPLFAQVMRFVKSCLDKEIPVVLIMSGDDNQLPPVGVGFPFRDVLGNAYGAAVPMTKLSVVHRQGLGSMITHACHQVLENAIPPIAMTHYPQWDIGYDEADFIWHLPQEFQHEIDAGRVLKNYAKYLSGRFGTNVSMRDVQVILPLRNQSKVEPRAPYVKGLNTELQAYFARQGGQHIHRYQAVRERHNKEDIEFQVQFATGDKVLHTGDNGYMGIKPKSGHAVGPVMRGSIGQIVEANPHEIWVRYPWMTEQVPYCSPTERSQIGLAYAITGHAAQGSEFEYVLLMVPGRAGPTLVDRGWLYTAMSRAKKHQLMIAPEDRISHAVTVNYGQERDTLLARKMLQI
jgi:hypothetical protein